MKKTTAVVGAAGLAVTAMLSGCVTNEAGTPASGESHQGDPAAIAVKARFVGGVDTNAQIAPIELFNQAQA